MWNRFVPAAFLALLVMGVAAVHADVAIDRADFKIALPDGSTIHPASKVVDTDHMTTATLPNDGTFIVLVIDQKDTADVAINKMLDVYKSKLTNPTEDKTTTFDKLAPVRSTAMTGTLNGVAVTFEVGQTNGKEKAFIFVFTYTADKKDATIDIVKKALDTFSIKE